MTGLSAKSQRDCGISVKLAKLEVIFQNTSLFPDTCLGVVKQREGLPLRNVDQLAAGDLDWREKNKKTEARLKSQDVRLKLGKGSFSQRL